MVSIKHKRVVGISSSWKVLKLLDKSSLLIFATTSHRLQLYQNCFRDKPHPVITTHPINMATPQITPTLIELNLWNHFLIVQYSCFLDKIIINES